MASSILSRKYRKKLLRYFERKKKTRISVITDEAILESDIPNDISINEIIGALTLFLISNQAPPTHIFQQNKIHPSWKNKFDESFFHNIEVVSWDLRTIGLGRVSRKLLKFGQLIADELGLAVIANRLHERLKTGIRGRASQDQSFGLK